MSLLETIKACKEVPVLGTTQVISTIEMHTGGEPLRVIVDGFPEIRGDNILQRRRFVQENCDHLRTALMFEPRGHADMYGCLLVEPNDEDGDFGIIFLHNEGYSTMCGHAIIAISKLVFQMGWKIPQEGDNVLFIDAPCGRIKSFTKYRQGQVEGVRFHCVPSFVVGLDHQVKIPGLDSITYDLAFGGAYYAYVDLRKNNLDLELTTDFYRQIIQLGMDIKRAVINQADAIVHPFEPDLGFLYGTIFIDDSSDESIDSRNVCVFADGEVDRSPTGSGVSGRMAIHHARGECQLGESVKIESIIGTVFLASPVKETSFGPYQAVVPEVAGTAYVVGQHQMILDPEDPLKHGFFLR